VHRVPLLISPEVSPLPTLDSTDLLARAGAEAGTDRGLIRSGEAGRSPAQHTVTGHQPPAAGTPAPASAREIKVVRYSLPGGRLGWQQRGIQELRVVVLVVRR
jgi:hypothetical protein